MDGIAVNEPYAPEEAAKNGDIVNIHGTFLNLDKWDGFLRNVEDKKEDRVRLTQYTIEGDPIFYELVYDGETIRYTYDNSMDTYGADSGRPVTGCTGIGSQSNESGQAYYALTGCDNRDTGNTFWFPKEEKQ